jgi:hypothetical protein
MAIRSSTRLVFTATSVSVAVIATGAFSTAKAAQFDFSYTGTGINASGVIATDATGTLITGITGQRNGVSITSVAAPNTLAGNDNVFNPTGNPAFLTFNGVSFNLASVQLRLTSSSIHKIQITQRHQTMLITLPFLFL